MRSLSHRQNIINILEKAQASLMSRWELASTMFLTLNRLTALSLGTERPQLLQRIGRTRPRACLERPPFLRLVGMMTDKMCYGCKPGFQDNSSK